MSSFDPDRARAMPAAGDPMQTARLLIACPDTRGVVAAVANFVAEHGGNLLDADQHTDAEHGEFFMRVVFDLTGCGLSRTNFDEHWAPIATRFGMGWQIRWSDQIKRMAIMVGTQAHCLQDLLWRWQAGELAVEIPVIISNHPTLEPLALASGIPFHMCPMEPEGKAAQERSVGSILETADVDFVVLARYMQILSPDFVAGWTNRIINIHHSFLPAFAGGDPYRQAYDRGVKLTGATSHYVTAELDRGPIIAQSVVGVSHRDAVSDLRRKGRDLERLVLAQAVRLHIEDKILVSKNKTVVFE